MNQRKTRQEKNNKREVINTTLPAHLLDEFRQMVGNVFGAKKGALSMALEEAIRDWLDKQWHIAELMMQKEREKLNDD